MVFRGILFAASKDRVILPPAKPLWKRGFDVFKIIHCSDAKIKKLLLAWLPSLFGGSNIIWLDRTDRNPFHSVELSITKIQELESFLSDPMLFNKM